MPACQICAESASDDCARCVDCEHDLTMMMGATAEAYGSAVGSLRKAETKLNAIRKIAKATGVGSHLAGLAIRDIREILDPPEGEKENE